MYNIELMSQILDIIENDPKKHDQSSFESDRHIPHYEGYEDDPDWEGDPYSDGPYPERDQCAEECGTTRCVAGWAIFLNNPGTDTLDDAMRMQLRLDFPDDVAARDRNMFSYSNTATRILGLTKLEAEALFYYASDVDARYILRSIVENGEFPWDDIGRIPGM